MSLRLTILIRSIPLALKNNFPKSSTSSSNILKQRSLNNGINLQSRCLSDWIHVERRKEYVMEGEEFKNAVANDAFYLIDVREKEEVANGSVPAKRYVNIPIGTIFQALSKDPVEFETEYGVPMPSKDEKVVVMCLAGIRSTWAFQVAQHFGFSKSKHYIGGWSDWQNNYKD